MLAPDDFDRLKRSRLVSRIVSEDFWEDRGEIRHKIRVELRNGWQLECWEHLAPGHRRYSFHIFLNRQLITCWDNSPRHRQVSTFPTTSTWTTRRWWIRKIWMSGKYWPIWKGWCNSIRQNIIKE